MDREASAVRIKRCDGRDGSELFVHATPVDDTAPAGEQLEQVVAGVASALTAQGAWDRIVHGTLFVDRRLIDTKPAALSRLGQRIQPVTVVGQPPAAPGRACELLVHAVGGTAPLAIHAPASGCAYVTTLQQPDCRRMWVGSALPSPGAPTFVAGARAAMKSGITALEMQGLSFDDLVRTWIRLRDIERDYAALNEARNELFSTRRPFVLARNAFSPEPKPVRLPASTGIEGAPADPASQVVIDLFAAAGAGVTVEPLCAASMCEAASYGAWFSRGVALRMPGWTQLLVSGTASIDAAGRIAHPGDSRAQVRQTLDNVRDVLRAGGADLGDVLCGIAYLASPALRGDWDEAATAAGLSPVLPLPVVEARVCRPGWLCEVEVMAARPTAAGAA